MNGVIMQFFHWYNSADANLWQELEDKAQELAQKGITAIWLPPAYKGTGGKYDVGYGVYDLFDLGEFNQKGTVRTKYGTKEQLLAAIEALHAQNLQVYADVVLNHKDGGDEIEEVWAQEVEWSNRNRTISDWHKITAYTKFTFPGRGDTYSSMKWFWWCFDALCYNATTKNSDKLYRLKDKGFETDVHHEYGNYDYLLANDLDSSNEAVREELKYWGRWFVDTTNVDGFRLDAVKHIRSDFFRDWLNHLRVHFSDRELFSVAEYWSGSVDDLHGYLADSDGTLSLVDVPLHYKFHQASKSGSNFDLRTICDRTLVKEQPSKAVTFVENHDTQPCQSLESPVEPWFKPLAYALILLRREGYPCIFYPDYYGAEYPNCRGGFPVVLYSHRFLIDKFLFARQAYGFGEQHDYFDHPNTIGWTRLGNSEHPGAMAVVLSNGEAGYKWMNVFRSNVAFYDCTDHFKDPIYTNSDGWGQFPCQGGSVSVWLQK